MQKNYATLNINIDPLQVPIQRFKLAYQTGIHIATELNQELISFLTDHNIGIIGAQTFYSRSNFIQAIHVDGKILGDRVKLNFVIGGFGSLMHWYNVKDEMLLKQKNTNINEPYLQCPHDAVTLIESANIVSASIVQVGRPHNIVNKDQPRLCVSIILSEFGSYKKLTMNKAIERLADCII